MLCLFLRLSHSASGTLAQVACERRAASLLAVQHHMYFVAVQRCCGISVGQHHDVRPASPPLRVMLGSKLSLYILWWSGASRAALRIGVSGWCSLQTAYVRDHQQHHQQHRSYQQGHLALEACKNGLHPWQPLLFLKYCQSQNAQHTN